MKVRITFIDEWEYTKHTHTINWEDPRMVRWFADAANKWLRKCIGNRVITETMSAEQINNDTTYGGDYEE